MKISKNIFFTLSIISLFVLGIASCEKDTVREAPAPTETESNSWEEDFTDVGKLGAKGWVMINRSSPIGPEGWRQGRYESTNKFTFGSDYVIGFPAYNATRSPNDFVSCDMYAGALVSNISAWLISPVFKIKNGDELTFYTRHHVDDGTFSGKDGTDRMQVWLNAGTSTNVGKTWNETGDFLTLITDINSTLDFGGYPEEWTKFSYVMSGLNGEFEGRIGFRYFVPAGGPDGNNSALVGLDAISFVSK